VNTCGSTVLLLGRVFGVALTILRRSAKYVNNMQRRSEVHRVTLFWLFFALSAASLLLSLVMGLKALAVVALFSYLLAMGVAC